MAILLKLIKRYKAIPVKVLVTFLAKLEDTILKFISNYKRPRIAKSILDVENHAEGSAVPDLRLCYKVTVLKNSTELAQK